MSKEHTFLENGKVVYDMISEERIREIIREEIAEYNEIFMSKQSSNFDVDMSMEDHGPGPDEDVWLSAKEWAKRVQERKGYKDWKEKLPEEKEVTATKMPIQVPVKLCSGEEFENMPPDDSISQESKQRRDYNKRWVQGK